MTGLPDLLVELDDGTGAFPFDITEYVHLVNGHSISRGRGAEFDTIDPSQVTITLRNNQGHFTLGSPAFGIFVDQMIRVTETVGATTSQRFTGYVQNWPTTWESAQASLSLSTVTAVDKLARLERRQLRSMLEQEILLAGPLAYYTLAEAAGSTSAGDTSGNTGSPVSLLGPGDPVVFGEATGPGGDSLTAATFTATSQILSGPVSATIQGNGLAFEFFCLAATPLTVSGPFSLGVLSYGVEALIDATGAIEVRVVDGGFTAMSVQSGSSVADGEYHHIAAAMSDDGVAATMELLVDGVSQGTDTSGPLTSTTLSTLSLGALLDGSLAHVAVYDDASVLPSLADRIDCVSGFAGEASDARVSRLASYANVTDLALESGVANMAVQQTSGGSAMSALSDVTATEGGSAFIDGAGALVFQNRSHRVRSATGEPVLELGSSDVGVSLTWSADKNYLVNYATGSRPDGAEQVAVNQGSIDVHEQYPASLSLLARTDTEVKHALQWQVANYGDVKPRITQVEIDLLTQPDDAIRETALSLELGDRITISGMPSQSPAATADLIVEGWTEELTKDSWTLTLNTISADHFKVWVLEDPVYGVLEGPFTRLLY